MAGEPLQTESPDPVLGKENGGVGCARGIVVERFSGEGTWNREARRVTLLAEELGVVLDEETLILCDVRDLMALRLGLQQALAGEARRPWAILRPGAGSGSVAVTPVRGDHQPRGLALLRKAVESISSEARR